jgi:hypothetical protein
MRQTTREHAEIRRWVEERGGRPARVRGSTVLRLAFDELPANWEAIEWQEFFETFDRTGLALWYEDTAGSRLCKLTKVRQSASRGL